MNSEQKKGLLSQLIRIMRVDGEDRYEELEFLWATAVFLNIGKPEFDLLLKSPGDYKPPIKEPNRIVQFYQMALLIRADNSHSEDEITYFKWLAVKMGLREAAAKAIIARIEENPLETLKPDEIIKIFQVFHN